MESNIPSIFKAKLNDSKISKIISVAEKLGFNPLWLMFVMHFESGISTTATNPVSGSVGLIQFTRDKAGVSYKTINGKRYELSVIKNMTFNEQIGPGLRVL
ncbi:transglycosylase SLT domain-containing protein [Flavobacterium sp. 3HN19-14]|uniref:transglycosylase SLT domain-containing protein n=1 Tax=Flavobacterium sp. 3HN19-14 TaxID=3448133 RepID=UPI003EDF326C